MIKIGKKKVQDKRTKKKPRVSLIKQISKLDWEIQKRFRYWFETKCVLAIGLAATGIWWGSTIGLETVAAKLPKRCVTGFVTGEQRIRSGDSSFYVFYLGGGAYSNKDSWAFGKFDSSNKQSQLTNYITNEQEATVLVSGWRIPHLSLYENLVSIHPNRESCQLAKASWATLGVRLP